MNKNKKWKSILLYFLLGALTIASVSLITWYVVKIIQNHKNNVDKFIEPIEESEYRDFSQKNSFKIELQSSNAIGGQYYVSQGTAWSWYYDQIDKYTYDWYLMTNLHVVNDAVAFQCGYTNIYNNDLIVDNNKLKNYYVTAIDTPYKTSNYFTLSKWSDYSATSGSYNNILDTQQNGSKIISRDQIKSIDIITDCNNNSIDLFSSNNYNLDMSLVKISLNFTSKPYLIDNLLANNIAPNTFDLYEKSTLEQKNEDLYFDKNKYIYIAGHPANEKRLISILFNPQQWMLTIEDWSKNPNNSEVLKQLKEPCYFSLDYYANFKLTSGASGSEVFQVNQDGDNLSTKIPIGIFWGGVEKNESSFKPSFIPFEMNYSGINYNIFDNFAKFVNYGA